MASKKNKTKRNATKRNARLQQAIAGAWGRPRKYDDLEEFDVLCRTYYATLKLNAPNIAGICAYLGISRDTWERYRKGIFQVTCMALETKIEDYWVTRLKQPGNGPLFYLKNFRPSEYKERGPGSSDDEPLHVKAITGMVIKRG